jgi:hypothetical protein
MEGVKCRGSTHAVLAMDRAIQCVQDVPHLMTLLLSLQCSASGGLGYIYQSLERRIFGTLLCYLQ